MALLKVLDIGRAPDYTKREYKCMSCGKHIIGGGDSLYAKRFCSEKCTIDYLR